MAAEVAPGTVVAGFEIEALLGRGAMAEVYRARDLEGDRVVALKLLEPVAGTDERFRSRFLRESQLAAAIEHPQIVRTLASGEADGRLYLAMELIDGSDLRQLLREQGRLQPEHAVQIVSQIADALDAAHQAGLVHRDVKPGNILLDTDGNAYVCDFGLARHVSSVSSLTGDRGFVGTIDYVPPEQIEGTPIDKRADIYSLGCVLYECLTGTRPYDRDSELAVVFAHLNEPPPHPTDTNPDLPTAFDTVIETALAKNPDHRYPTTTNLATAAQAALHGRVLPRRRPRRRLSVLSLGALVVAVVSAIAGALLVGNGHSRSPVTITPTSIEGAKLGDANLLLTRMWGRGQTLTMTEPPNYSMLRQRLRNTSAYFIGTTDKAVELTTWNSRDRTAEGIGPCSTLAELKRVYGKNLKASPNSTSHEGVVYGWTVGKHMFFAMTFPTPNRVNTVALFSNPRPWAGFNASNEAPCAPAVVTTPATRPKVIPVVKEPNLPATFVSSAFRPRLTVHTPAGWSRRSDTPDAFTLGSRAGASLQFLLDPRAASTQVSGTPRGLTQWLQRLPGIVVASPQTILLGTPALTSTVLDLRARAVPTTYLVASRGNLEAVPGERTRLYLAPIRIGSLSHTLAIVLRAHSQAAFATARATTAAILKRLRISAAAAANLSALSGFCSFPFNGTCRGEIDPGTYSTRTMTPSVTYTVPVGWTNSGDLKGYMGLIPPGGDYTGVDAGQSDYINVFSSIATGNGRCADGHGTIHTPEGILRWIRGQPGFAPIHPVPVSIGGLTGIVVDLRMRKDFKATCPWSHGFPAQQVLTGLPPSPDQLNHSLPPGHAVMRLYLLHYKGGTLGIEIDDVRDDARMKSYNAVVKTMRFTLPR